MTRKFLEIPALLMENGFINSKRSYTYQNPSLMESQIIKFYQKTVVRLIRKQQHMKNAYEAEKGS